ncbi:UNVERIFIED_CONTAM: hypothetical protein FKN15_072565 [Acipenser sinensis]
MVSGGIRQVFNPKQNKQHIPIISTVHGNVLFKRGMVVLCCAVLCQAVLCWAVLCSLFVPEFEAECKKSASSDGVTLPPQFSVQRMFEEVTTALKINKPMLEAAAIFLDDIGANLKVAREMGMATILVGDTTEALKELQTLSGVQLLGCEEFMPSYCRPTDVAHGFVSIKPGVKIHYVEMGDGPPLCLCHGFPESWFSWRYQIPALADAGFRVLALDMKGYGESTAPPGAAPCTREDDNATVGDQACASTVV